MKETQKVECRAGLHVELTCGVETAAEELNMVWNSTSASAVLYGNGMDAVRV